ncbi:hypothetical protein AWB80_02850 [Caballeronia pedi]|uniref:Uncharacterized protein n=1 Tax=Caballeronia pedi TaxID=1777141 RepID=A0A158AZT0_9BURK|nr:hypothetical protein [Caballeronia pedi]SAK63305.1 hypothetical protein AWB80_02850 [Caballeronia pedi]
MTPTPGGKQVTKKAAAAVKADPLPAKRGPGRPRRLPIVDQPAAVLGPPTLPPKVTTPKATTLGPIEPDASLFPMLLEESRKIQERWDREERKAANEDIETTDRAGAAQMIGASVSVVIGLEQDDPDWPAPFKVGKQNYRYLKRKVRDWLNKKAADAERLKHGLSE